MRWAYGIMSCTERMASGLAIKTLSQLEKAGFTNPPIFTDGGDNLSITTHRRPKIGPFGNWLLGMWELYIRNPNAERYAMFQDDIVCYRNLREYLERSTSWGSPHYVREGYWNLFTFTASVDIAKHQPSNEELVPHGTHNQFQGWYKSNQLGRGAVALVFDRDGLRSLLTHPYLFDHVQDHGRGTRRIDGAVCDVMKDRGYTEYVHWPSLVQHTGDVSTIGNPTQKPASSFRGKDFDALDLLKAN